MALIERDRRETVVLVGVAIPPVTVDEAEASLDELAALADTAGADEAERVLQRTRFGGGETKLEVDRRRLLRRATKLEADLRDLAQDRRTQRKSRARSRLSTVALVGYTNTGKSTLLNRLTDAHVLVEDRLFATVDPTTRRLTLPGGEPLLVTDTVGFVRKLPHQLVEAFRSTLEEVGEADLLIHVVDVSVPDPEAQIRAVRTVLSEIGADQVPELLAFNKVDRLEPDDKPRLDRLIQRHPGSVVVSAVDGEGIETLLSTVADRLRALFQVVELVVPYERGDVVSAVHRHGEVLSEEHEGAGTRVQARLHLADVGRFAEFQAAP
ncbi:MAG: GTPase HflX [Actinobacteria bacterium]|nr:GTPase HflX [Actinomycetota bacterium]